MVIESRFVHSTDGAFLFYCSVKNVLVYQTVVNETIYTDLNKKGCSLIMCHICEEDESEHYYKKFTTEI